MLIKAWWKHRMALSRDKIRPDDTRAEYFDLIRKVGS